MTDGPESQTPPSPEHLVPSWLRPVGAERGESSWPVIIAIIAIIAIQHAIPDRYTIVPRWPLLALEVLLLLVLIAVNPLTPSKYSTAGRWASWLLTGAITIDNTASAAVLDYKILTGQVSDNAAVLLGSGGAIYITNVIAFGIWFWELDRGGPLARLQGRQAYPDFLFPQMTDPDNSPPNWRPIFIDYLYVSFTNAVAFSPTDTMPMARWAKVMMAVQAVVATTTIALVFARAVSLLN